MLPISKLAALLLSVPPISAQVVSHRASILVPFVGCRSDGQLGPKAAPNRTSKSVHLSPEAAEKLAWYQGSEGPGVLAPRGWFCFATYGSSGSTTYVSPQPLTRRMLLSEHWKGLDGPAVELSYEFGGTSGRFSVADAVARSFPAYKAFVQSVMSEGFTLDKIPTGPFRTDNVQYKNDHTVEFTTPAHLQGLGTQSRLLPSGSPISGVNLLTGADTDLVSLSIRLPAGSGSLAPAIAGQVEQANRTPPPKP